LEQGKIKLPQCAECNLEKKICNQEDGKGPAYCPTINLADVVEASLSAYGSPEIRELSLSGYHKTKAENKSCRNCGSVKC